MPQNYENPENAGESFRLNDQKLFQLKSSLFELQPAEDGRASFTVGM